MATLGQVSCAHHPDRRGFALCVSCRKVVCQECATPFEGAYRCRPCLLAQETKATRETPLLPLGLLAVGALLCVAAAYAMVWGGALLARSW